MAVINKSEEQQINGLFSKLERNRNGKFDFKELKQALKHNENDIRLLYDQMIKCSTNGTLEFVDFVEYVNQTDKNQSQLMSVDIDYDKIGRIDENEIKLAFSKLDIILNDNDVKAVIRHIHKKRRLKVDWSEWKRDLFRFETQNQFDDMLRHWGTESFVDYGDQPLPNDYTKIEKETGLWWRHLVAGGAAGVLSRTCTAPLDRIKIFMQVHGTEKRIKMVSAIKHMIKEGGVKSMWRGNGVNVLKIGPESAIKFMAYEQIKALMGKDGESLPPWQKLISGSLAGFIAQSSIYPMEVLKTRLALRKTGQYSSASDCIRKIYYKEGIRAFYRGYLINTIGILPAVGIDLALYETLKNKYKELYPNETYPSSLTVVAIANIAATAAMFSSYPLLLIKTRLQSSTNSKDNVKSIIFRIWKKDGFFGFYRGCIPNLAKVVPSSALGYVTYENVGRYLGLKR